jgi:predicted MFS family arabinose efflux permease
MTLGQAMVGLLSPLMLIPILPELVEAAESRYPGDKSINNLAAGVFNAFLGIGQLVAPPFGTLMFSHYGFRTTAATVSAICLAYACIYIIKGDGL